MAEQSLKEAKDWLRERVYKGARCPCCDRYARAYRRILGSSMATALICLYRESKKTGEEWVHAKTAIHKGMQGSKLFKGLDYGVLKFWGLIEANPEHNDETKPSSGFWRVTNLGKDFVEKRTAVQKYSIVYDNRFLRLEGPVWTIDEALGKHFNYQELMEAS